ncbi:sensor histidine kinase [Vogesella oryzae]|uniref:sensor histidine kinase n=1 Tax=Vogesella oryzae TaxID=1735285 RepID=UPI0015820ADB|nr:HAMP domain-containing sensor histidine kinase [Vogesella oryzae]
MQGNSEQLREVFEHFNSVTDELIRAYKLLESQVAELNGKLQQANDELLQKSEANERLAAKLTALLAAMPVGVVELDREGVVSAVNEAATALLPDLEVKQSWQLDALLDRDAQDGEFLGRRGDGSIVFVSVAEVALQGQGSFVLLVDVTHLRQLHEQLAQQAKLASMGRMAASLAHQIRTPLATALLYAANLCRSDLQEEAKGRFASKVVDRLRALESLVQDMLSFVRSGVVEGVQERFDVGLLLQEVELIVSPLLEKKHLHWQLRVGEAGAVQAVRSDLVGALVNLIENACQFCPDYGQVWLESSVQAGQVLLRVANEGEAIPDGLQQQIFDPFFTTRANGTGLGLAIVKRVVEDMKGSIRYTRDGGMTVFELRIPIAVGAAIKGK